jgi:hypothetical protein
VEFTRWLRLQWDRVGAALCVGVGLLALLLGWIGVSGVANPGEQMPYILSGGVTGIFLIGLAAVLWLSADMRDEWRKLDRIEEYMRTNGRPGDQVVNGQSLTAPIMMDPNTSGPYGPPGWVPAGYAPYPAQPLPGQPYAGQPYAGEPYAGEPHQRVDDTGPQPVVPDEDPDLAYAGVGSSNQRPASGAARRRPLTASGRSGSSASRTRRASLRPPSAEEDGEE